MTGDATGIEGCRVRLRLVTPGDAAFVHRLRTDPALNAHLSPVAGTVADQRAWLAGYKAREAAGREYYYVIERLDGVACGLVRLYGLEKDRVTWGSWILDRNKPPKAALESAVLSFAIAFERLGLGTAAIDVRLGNERAIRFYRRFGMRQTGQDGLNLYFEYRRGDFLRDRDRHLLACRGE